MKLDKVTYILLSIDAIGSSCERYLTLLVADSRLLMQTCVDGDLRAALRLILQI